jgi:beta-phosphoglucomutase-like phosphatase (HAD superfamily)
MVIRLAAKDLQPIPGFHLFVEWVKKHNLRRAAVTNSPRLNAEQVLTALKVTDFFELLVVGNECKRPKPFPDPYLQAIKFFGIDPKQCFVFEVGTISLLHHGNAYFQPILSDTLPFGKCITCDIW